MATDPAFPVYDGPIRILFRDHPTWIIKLNSRIANGERVSVRAFLKHLYDFIHADMDQDQYSISTRTEDSHEVGRLPRMASPQPSFGMTPNYGPRVVDRRVTSTGAGRPRGMRRYDFLGGKRVFAGLMPPQHPQDGSAWYVVLAEANATPYAATYPSTRY
ncbi:hypothetical protein D9619_011013 [Psilocybe cf. subviscida]|uniref:DUF6699 domain-containing protein n=1 Tax=Psilocybe cf. subviscida TaxID=2480587 RepID=A0A8H5F077_9AGAR|nr:hypothetical protein D9619_011013 [Psilocybe cf. subviscida]